MTNVALCCLRAAANMPSSTSHSARRPRNNAALRPETTSQFRPRGHPQQDRPDQGISTGASGTLTRDRDVHAQTGKAPVAFQISPEGRIRTQRHGRARCDRLGGLRARPPRTSRGMGDGVVASTEQISRRYVSLLASTVCMTGPTSAQSVCAAATTETACDMQRPNRRGSLTRPR